MSISSVISSMQTNLGNAYTALSAKGATIPQNKNLENLSNAITSIPSGGGGGGGSTYTRPADWLTIPTMSGTTDDIYILNGVGINCPNKIYFKVSGTGTIDWGDGSSTTTFTNVSQATYSHEYNYDDLSSSSWTDHNNCRQALIHISGTRQAITYFSTAGITYSYTNADGNAVNYNTNISTDIYQISANVASAEVYCSTNSGQKHFNLEIFDWVGTISNSSLAYMFGYCYSLQSVPQLTITNATSTSNMFLNCYSLQSVPLFATSNVTNMSSMFAQCYSLSNIPLFVTSKVTNMSSIFTWCASLTTIPQLNTEKVTNAQNMFSTCYSLETIPLIDTSKATNMSYMFSNCYSLKSIPQLNTSAASTMNYMFSNCYSISTIPELNTSSATNMSNMFNQCRSLKTIPQLNTGKVTNMASMFSNCNSLVTIPQLDTSKVTDMSNMFSYCYALEYIPRLNTKNVTNMSNTFSTCYSLKKVPQLNTSNVTSMSGTFGTCYSLVEIPELDATKVTNTTSSVAADCSLQKIKFYNFNPKYSSAITLSNLSSSTMLTNQALVDLFNSVAPNSNSYSRTIQIGTTMQNRLSNCYVKDSGSYYTAILPTSDTSIQSGKTYYTYNEKTDAYTQVTPDFTSSTFYYELKTASWKKYVICSSSDSGAMLALNFARNVKKYTIS